MVNGYHNEPFDPFAVILGCLGAVVAIGFLVGNELVPENTLVALVLNVVAFAGGFAIGAGLWVLVRWFLDPRP